MVLRRYFGLLYGTLVVLIVALGVWWVYFLTSEGRTHEQIQLQRLSTDQIQANYLIQTVPQIAADPASHLSETYPHLLFRETATGYEAEIDPEAIDQVRQEVRRRQRMFTAEGIFFLLLLAAGTTILTLAFRSEREFKRARELFLTGATHELKTPLASLRLYTETLQRPNLKAASAERIHAHMVEDVERLENLVEQILALGYDEEGAGSHREVLDVGQETRDVLGELEGFLAGHGATVATDLPAEHLVWGQRFIFSLLLRNLLSNAVYHSRGPARIHITLGRDGAWVRLAVKDSGPGISRAERKNIFKEFVRGAETRGPEAEKSVTNQQHNGAGLGLYLVKRKVEMMGGKVELDSKPGEGATFTLVMPAYEGGDR
jgi:signal transduction histidine kinase